MIGSRERQAPARSEHPRQLREQPDPVLHVLEHLAQPDAVEGAGRERQLALADEQELELAEALAGAAQRLLRDVDADDVEAGGCQLAR